MTVGYSIRYFGQAYGSGNFGSCDYSSGCTSATTGAGGNAASTGSSGLANTGIAVGLIVGVACLIVFISLVVRFARRSKQASNIPEAVVVDNDDQDFQTRDQ